MDETYKVDDSNIKLINPEKAIIKKQYAEFSKELVHHKQRGSGIGKLLVGQYATSRNAGV